MWISFPTSENSRLVLCEGNTSPVSLVFRLDLPACCYWRCALIKHIAGASERADCSTQEIPEHHGLLVESFVLDFHSHCHQMAGWSVRPK